MGIRKELETTRQSFKLRESEWKSEKGGLEVSVIITCSVL